LSFNHATTLVRRLVAIGVAAGVIFLGVVLVGPRLAGPRDRPADSAPATLSTGRPISAEADVFRLSVDSFGAPPDAGRRALAHPRTLAMYRTLRAYPEAPPRIPHGLTAAEFREPTCNTCHQRGGWVARFGAYAPVTPHPEYGACLQCHAVDDAVAGIRFTDAALTGGDATCLQCHVAGQSGRRFVMQGWRPAAWPAVRQAALAGSPPTIPHDLQLRGNCLACHAGPGAVAELRTTHPERANCRQCHVPTAGPDQVFVRPLDGGIEAVGGEP
jgi:cytochrome c-type protein NapB